MFLVKWPVVVKDKLASFMRVQAEKAKVKRCLIIESDDAYG